MEIECTQRLDCTQDQYTQSEKIEPEQIGFLGICGAKYPVKKGPNKIGRDPQTCRIVLNLNSISRQHAVINVLNSTEFMLMDLDSANRTKVQGKVLQPFIPHPLKNGDMVQFGDVFGVFRLLEDENDLPMTQAIDIPCTPVPVAKQVSKCGAPSVLVPESPEVSDRDDSFIMPSQPKLSSEFKSPMSKFLKPSNKTVAIQPMGSKKIDNAYWASGKKSESFNFHLDDSGSSLNDSTNSNHSNKVIDDSAENIHEMETQAPYNADDSTDSIYTANTQLPPTPSVHIMETQQPLPDIHSLETQQLVDIHALNTQNIPDIHECATQIPPDVLPEVCKVNVRENVQFDLFSANKENDNSIFNAETQVFPIEKEAMSSEAKKPESLNVNSHETSKERNDSDDEIVFDEISTQSFQEEFESQPLLSTDVSPHIEIIEKIELNSKSIPKKESSPADCDDLDILPTQKITLSPQKARKLSGSSTDCEDFDILPTQKITTDIDMLPTQKLTNDIEILPTQKITIDDDDLTDCEDEFVNNEVKVSKESPEVKFEDMATQVLGDDEIEAELIQSKDQTDGPSEGTSFAELPTQIITEDSKEENFEDMPTQIITDDVQDDGIIFNQEVYSEEMIISPFKVPLPTPVKAKKVSKLALAKTSTPIEKTKVDADDPNYYADTQDLLTDLCSQRQDSPKPNKSELSKPAEMLDDDEIVPCSVEDYEMGDRFRHIENDLSPVKKLTSRGTSSTPDRNKKGVINKQVPKATTSSDIDVRIKTPKTLKIINTDLPDSQEIKTSVTLKHRSITESSSDTEPEDVSDQDLASGLGKKKRNNKVYAKIDLTKRFEESLPTRVITRVRKPTYKIQNSDESTKKQCKSILKNSLFDSEDSIDAEIISENISRLKGKSNKKKDKDKNNSKNHTDETKKRPESRNSNRKTDKSVEDSNKASGSRSSRSKSKKSEESKSKTDHADDSKEETRVRSTRSSRNKKENDRRDSKRKSEKDNKKHEEKEERDSKSRSRTRNDYKESAKAVTAKDSNIKGKKDKESVKPDSSPEIVRYSKRQRSKETKHENSTVYLSSDTSVESPKTLKRPASNELEVPSSKRTRSLPTSKSSVSKNPSGTSCSTPVRSEKHYVLFTAFSNDEVRSKLENVGAVIVTDVVECTVLVTMQIKRTFKLLCAVGLGRPIVGPDWVQACVDSNAIVDPWLYIIKDTAAEKRFNFSLEGTLRGARGFLRGYNVSSTPSVLPNAQEMKLIVECSGGTWREGGSPWVVVSSSGDRALWGGLRRRGARVVTTEFILGGVLRQRPDVDAALFGNATNKKKGGSVGEFVCEECGRRCLSRIGLSSHAKSHMRA